MRKFGATELAYGPKEGDWVEVRELLEKFKERRTDLPLIAGSLLMYLAGRFEYYVRQLVEGTAEEMAISVDCYRKLPKKFRACLKSQVLEVLQNPRRYGFDDLVAEGHLKDYSTLLDGHYNGNKVSSSLLALTEANLKSRVLADVTRRLGMEDLWKDIGKQASFKLALDKSTDQEATVEGQSRLDALMHERNELAHPTGQMTFPDPDKVIETVKYLRALSQALRDLFRVYLAQWPTQAEI